MEIINHEYYVSPEVAKLLKEAGFNWEIRSLYDEQNNFVCSLYRDWNNVTICKSAPTLDVAQRWLREVKNIFIEVTRYETINPLSRELFEAVYDKTVDQSFAYRVNVLDANNESIYDEDCFLTYEEAQETGIKKALEIILEK